MIKTLSVNVSGRDFVVGDLHGMFDMFQEFLEHIKFMPREDRIISVGDLIDRGDKNLECLQLLDNEWFHCVKGNHEQLMEEYFKGSTIGTWWMYNGGGWYETLEPSLQLIATSYLDELDRLPYLITVPMTNGKKFHVLHAELFAEKGELIFDSDLEDVERFKLHAESYLGDGEAVLWGRDIWGPLYARSLDNFVIGKIKRTLKYHAHYFNEDLSHIYSGHTTLKQPVTIEGQTGLDTGAFRTLRGDNWAGLTFTEPLTGKFWTVKKDGVKEVQPLVI
jgi:serine/threonine protein phosphatase 1